MNTGTYVAFVLVVSAALLLRNGATETTLAVLAGFALVAAIPWYFGTRDVAAKPSGAERVAATLWVWLRRIVGFTAGTLMIAAALALALSGSPSKGPAHSWLGAIVLFAIGAFFIYVGLVGQGPKRYRWRDDLELHQKNKRRYRWWF